MFLHLGQIEENKAANDGRKQIVSQAEGDDSEDPRELRKVCFGHWVFPVLAEMLNKPPFPVSGLEQRPPICLFQNAQGTTQERPLEDAEERTNYLRQRHVQCLERGARYTFDFCTCSVSPQKCKFLTKLV